VQRYCAARFERGTGFGNRLFPWARCHLHALRSGSRMLAPRWWWPPRLKPLLKEPPAAREWPGHLYLRGIRDLPEYISGSRRAVIEATSRNDVLVFRGEAGHFHEFAADHALLFDALNRMASRRLHVQRPYMAAHVRRGDFVRVSADEARRRGGARTPTEWFVASVRSVRAVLNTSVPLLVVTDGREDEIRPLLAEPNVQLVRTGAPLSDILVLAGARVLFASGSSFSAWGAFLGGMPTATHPGQSVTWFGVPARDWIGEFDPDAGDDGFVRAAASALN
jgi:hypothetical protein